MQLSTAQSFEMERMRRTIDDTSDPAALRALCRKLLEAWMSQKAATQWAMRQQLGRPSQIARDAAQALLQQNGGTPGLEAPPKRPAA
jgi:hypothetical protein